MSDTRESGSRIMQAVKDTRQRKGVQDPVDMREFWTGTILKFGLGLPLQGYGWWLFHHTFEAASKAWESGGFTAVSLLRFVPAIGVVAISFGFLAPTQTEAVARFLGLGNLIDKLPLIKRAP